MTTIAMLGLGSMNGAILSGLLKSGVEPEDVIATSRSAESARTRSQRYGVRVLSEEEDPQANVTAAGGADVVFLGVKPHQIVELSTQIASALKPGAVVVSVAAAVTVEMMEAALEDGQPVIRTMPNTPMSVGIGVVGLTPGAHTTQEQTELVARLLEGSGAVYVLPEEQIDALSAVAGSGPAYAFYLAEHMAAAGAELGLEPELSAQLAADTIYGAGKMLVENQGTSGAAQLRRNVTSPNGTTQKAIEAFDDAGMGHTIRTGAQAAAARAAEITRSLES